MKEDLQHDQNGSASPIETVDRARHIVYLFRDREENKMTYKVLRSFTSLLLALAFSLAGFSPALAAPPANDNFADAEAIPVLPFSDSVDITEATIEPNEPQNCSNSPNTVWYSFTPSANAVVSADMAGSSFVDAAVLSIYQDGGSGIGSLIILQCTYYGNSAIFNVQAGITYYIQAGSVNTGGGDLHLNLQEIPPPPNDNFANATIIAALPFSDSVDSTGASRETDEPYDCYGSRYTVWYSFTAPADGVIRADMAGSNFSDTQLNVYKATGPGFGGLSFVNCGYFGNPTTFSVQVGTVYYIQAGSVAGSGGDLHVNLQEIPSPPNDDFRSATLIPTPLPFDDTVDTSAAGIESDEPTPSCGYFGLAGTVWYAFTPATSGFVSETTNAPFYTLSAVYTGNSLASLTELGCSPFYGSALTFYANAGTIYYFQTGAMFPGQGQGGSMHFHLDVTPPLVANFYFNPSDPSKYDTIQFNDISYDPANIAIDTWDWNFGDGSIASGNPATHKYAADGDYEVSHTVKTMDGRTASITQTVQVRTHDVGITKVTAPQSARPGQTKTITVAIRNTRYPETVTVDLYKSTPGGDVWINSITLQVPVLSGNKTKTITFTYTFTLQDAQIGKVTFRAVASINGVNDAFPQDNTGISSPPTKVTR